MRKLKEMLTEDRGQALVLTAIGFTMLVSLMALALDTGVLFRAKRRLQVAADAAAIAGTLDYLYNGSSDSAKTAAKAASSQNGFTDSGGDDDGGGSGVRVKVSIPPDDGPNAGNSAFLEVIVSKPISTTFMGIAGFKTVMVKARAVAGVPTNGAACIWLMANSGTGLDVQGAYDIEATGCGIYVNSPSNNALSVTGNGGTLNAKFLDVVGNSTSVHATSPTAPTLNAAPRTSPWGNLTGPTPTNGGCTTTDTSTTSITGTVTGPGLGNAICYTKAVTLNGATMGAGTYMFENGVTISGTVTVNSGTIDIYSGTFNQPSNTLLNITAPTSGTYNGIAILQTATDTHDLQVQFGSNNQTLDGYIFALGAEVYLQDHGGGITATGIVAKTMYDKASTIRIPSYDVAHPSTTPNRVVSLVE